MQHKLQEIGSMRTVNRDDVWRTATDSEDNEQDLKFVQVFVHNTQQNQWMLDIEHMIIQDGSWAIDQRICEQVLEVSGPQLIPK